MKPVLSEDEILDLVARFLVIKGYRILAVGANQAGLFRFHTKAGGQKAPDLVAFLDPILLVCEAKIRSSDLFRKSISRESDYECMLGLARSQKQQIKLEDEAQRVLRGLGVAPPNVISIKVGLIGATPFASLTILPPPNEVLFLEIDPSRNITVHRDSEGCIPA